MKRLVKQARVTAVWVAIVSAGTLGNAWAANFERMFILGDSLSDPGNIYALTGETSQAPYAIVPDRPYDIDGFQFSNGKTWAQSFARHLEMKRSGQAALLAPGVNGNYAFGGARAGSTDAADPISATSQLMRYLGDHGYSADPDALYVLQFGGNDVRDALGALLVTGDFGIAQGIVENAVETELNIIQQLYQLGARQFLVVNVPDISRSPAVQIGGAPAAFAANLLTGGYNAGLEAGLQAVEGAPGISIQRFDLHAVSAAILTDPGDYGIMNAEAPCLMFMTTENVICDKPQKYFFFDGIHPTAKVHKIVSEEAAKLYE
jgi:outer membrane lipase/esterase